MRRGFAFDALTQGSLPWLLCVAAIAAATGQGIDAEGRIGGLCGGLDLGMLPSMTLATLGTFPTGQLVGSWGIMVLGMMPPLVSSMINHVSQSSLPRRRARAITLTLLSYASIWMLAGAALIPLTVSLVATMRGWSFPVALLAALAWSCSPIGQRSLDRCHRTVRIGLSGSAADKDCLRQGVQVAAPCVAACWPWMLAVNAAGAWHLPAMLAATAFLLLERLAPSRPARWGMPRAAAFAIG